MKEIIKEEYEVTTKQKKKKRNVIVQWKGIRIYRTFEINILDPQERKTTTKKKIPNRWLCMLLFLVDYSNHIWGCFPLSNDYQVEYICLMLTIGNENITIEKESHTVTKSSCLLIYSSLGELMSFVEEYSYI